MVSQAVIEREQFARAIWPEEAVDYLCANGKMSGSVLGGTIMIEGQFCCIVGALNVAAAKVTGKMQVNMVMPVPRHEVAYQQLRQVTGKSGSAIYARMVGMTRRWDVESTRGRKGILDRMCGRVTV